MRRSSALRPQCLGNTKEEDRLLLKSEIYATAALLGALTNIILLSADFSHLGVFWGCFESRVRTARSCNSQKLVTTEISILKRIVLSVMEFLRWQPFVHLGLQRYGAPI